jgi:hypothetical protein
MFDGCQWPDGTRSFLEALLFLPLSLLRLRLLLLRRLLRLRLRLRLRLLLRLRLRLRLRLLLLLRLRVSLRRSQNNSEVGCLQVVANGQLRLRRPRPSAGVGSLHTCF